MAIARYVGYLIGTALLTWLLTYLEISSPGSLRLHVIGAAGDTLGTSEYSPVEILQNGILIVCGLLYAWIARHYPSQRPIALMFGGLALAFTVRELDYFLDRHVADNFWQVMIAIIAALLITYVFRNRRRFGIAWLRLWPSPGLTLLFAGALVHFSFALLVGHEPLWMAILGGDYQRIVKLAVEEFIELSGYYLWLIGTIEYVFQVRAISLRDPQPVAVKRRAHKPKGRY